MLEDYINGALSKGLITKDKGVLKKTPLGSKFTNDLVEIFLG